MKLKLAENPQVAQDLQSFRQFIPVVVPEMSRLSLLTEDDRTEALGFLAERPVHTVVMTSFIHDNGIDNVLNRGKFYGYKNASGNLEAVALIGHTTLIEARTDDALTAIALQARESETPIHIVMSEGKMVESFWDIYSGGLKQPRLICSERLFEIKFPVQVREFVPGLRMATEADLMPIAEAHAQAAFEECGVNPMLRDREAYLNRVLRRINLGRVWTVFNEAGKLVFKADIAAETPEVSYLEGIYVDPEYRGQGIGTNCLSQLSRVLLETVKYVCLLSNEDFIPAHRAYLKAGFKSQDSCVTIFA